MPMNRYNKTALITGGARGIGSAIAMCLGSEFNVIIAYKNSEEKAMLVVNQLDSAAAIRADVSSSEQVEQLIKQVNADFGRVDLLVNNAGIAQQKLFTDITEEDWDRMFNTNVKSMYLLSRAVLPQMISQKYGRIVNISSMWGEVGASCEVHYSASKAAVIGFTKALAKEVGLSGITVNCVSPGVILTDMNSSLSTADMDCLRADTPINRLGTPEDVAQMVAFLASDKASFITGQIIGVNGGYVI